jgi:hypothetical protein
MDLSKTRFDRERLHLLSPPSVSVVLTRRGLYDSGLPKVYPAGERRRNYLEPHAAAVQPVLKLNSVMSQVLFTKYKREKWPLQAKAHSEMPRTS